MTIEPRIENQIKLEKTNEHVQLLTFKFDEQEYGLDIANVVQVVRMVAVTRPPRTSDSLDGIINLRGKVIPVIDLRRRCGLTPKEHDLNTQLLITQTNEQMLALTVDVVSEVLTLPRSNIVPANHVSAGMEFLSSIAKLGERLILILDLNQVLAQNALFPTN
jgi:purine-binding chemotaxis protein CheW